MLRLITQGFLRILPASFVGKSATKIYLLLFRSETRDVLKLAAWVNSLKIQTVLDVGAHVGQTALAYHRILPNADILSFEPNPEAYATLEAKTRAIPKIQRFKIALGDENRIDILQANVFSASSSLLPLDQQHKELYPHAIETTPQEVTVRRLDDFVREHPLKAPILLKMDVQGYEKFVLAGAEKTLNDVVMVMSEIGYQPLYQGQTDFDDLYQFLAARGFVYKGPWGEISRDSHGFTVYTNAVFMREAAESKTAEK